MQHCENDQWYHNSKQWLSYTRQLESPAFSSIQKMVDLFKPKKFEKRPRSSCSEFLARKCRSPKRKLLRLLVERYQLFTETSHNRNILLKELAQFSHTQISHHARNFFNSREADCIFQNSKSEPKSMLTTTQAMVKPKKLQ